MNCPECDEENWKCAMCGAADCINCGSSGSLDAGEVYCDACLAKLLAATKLTQTMREALEHLTEPMTTYQLGVALGIGPWSPGKGNQLIARSAGKTIAALLKRGLIEEVTRIDGKDAYVTINAARSRQPQPQPEVAVLTVINGGVS